MAKKKKERFDEIAPFAKASPPQDTLKKSDLFSEKQELNLLLQNLPKIPPAAGTAEHGAYLAIEGQISALKAHIAKKHGEWMELVESEEKLSREIGQGNP